MPTRQFRGRKIYDDSDDYTPLATPNRHIKNDDDADAVELPPSRQRPRLYNKGDNANAKISTMTKMPALCIDADADAAMTSATTSTLFKNGVVTNADIKTMTTTPTPMHRRRRLYNNQNYADANILN